MKLNSIANVLSDYMYEAKGLDKVLSDETVKTVLKGRGMRLRGRLKIGCTLALIITTLIFISVFAQAVFASTNSFGLLDARAKGVFNIGPGKGNVTKELDELINKDVLKFNYSVPKGSIIGVWTKDYPAGLGKDAADAVKIGIRAANADQVNQVSVKMEIKGTKDIQAIPLNLEPGWNSFRESINWNIIGELKEVVFVVSPMAVGPMVVNPIGVSPMEIALPVAGTLYFDLEFGKLTFLEKNFIFIKVGLILLVSLLAALFMALLGRLFGLYPSCSQLKTINGEPGQPDYSQARVLSRLKWDFIYGTVIVSVIGTALWIYFLGTMCPLNANFCFLAAGLIGAVIAELLKLGITGKHLTSGEVFQDVLLVGFLAATSSRLELLQAPATWAQVLMISSLLASLTFLIYQVSSACSLVLSGRHLRAVTGALIVLTPYLLGWLLLLENANLLQELGSCISAGALRAWPVILGIMGRSLIVFCFNEAVINGISMAVKGRIIKTPRIHLFALFISLSCALSVDIANLGSTAAVASLPAAVRFIVSVLTTMLSHAGLWAEVYLITGMILDGIHRNITSLEDNISRNTLSGMKKGMAYSGIFMAILYILNMLLNAPVSQAVMSAFPIMAGIMSGALVFPLLKTIIESFDGSLPFCDRMRYSYRDASLYARGAVSGFGFTYMITHMLFQQEMPSRIIFGLIIGLVASVGVSFLRDLVYTLRGQGRIQPWRLYFIDSLLGAFIGSAVAFYLDSSQVPVVIEKFKLYTSAGLSAVDYITYPLVNKWGRIDLGSYTGGVKLLFIEALAGVINWSIAAWLFAINRVFMEAFFQKDRAPIKFFFSKAGFVDLVKHMLYVLRWGLWMSPIIFTFLRMMPNPTWYNQDGAIRTLFAAYHNMTMSPEAFRDWSLKIFVYIMAFDFFRILIWMDHMGLRVATLVNLSFMGMDKLDERISRFIGPAAAQCYIPEAVKRFTTWAPLLLPFYIPRGEEWDSAWGASQAMQNAAGGKGIFSTLKSLSLPQILLLIVIAVLVCTGISFAICSLRRRQNRRREKSYELGNREYKVVLKENGSGYSEVIQKGYDISRRSYDTIDPCGRALFIVDTSEVPGNTPHNWWPVVGNFPKESFEASRIKRDCDSLKVFNTASGIETSIDIRLPDEDSSSEIWTIDIHNLTDKARRLKVIPYLEWVLNHALDDRFHTQYARLFPVMEYVSGVNSVLAWHKNTKSMGILASETAPEGFLTSRVDFIGRAQSIWSPRVLKTLDFLDAVDTPPYPTFDPIGSLMLGLEVAPKASGTVRLMIGYSTDKKKAIDLINKHLKIQGAKAVSPSRVIKKSPLIGHGEILPGTPQPYSEFIDSGNKLLVRTPYTPRPYDHAMSNELGHSIMVTNRGLHMSSNGNSQQNRLTPDWPDTVTKEIPAEAIYLYDPDKNEWYSPVYHPLNDPEAKYESEFGVDGTAVFRMTKQTVSTELAVFVPPDDSLGVYLLTVRNNEDYPRRMRIAPYFQIALSFQPELAGCLAVRYEKALDALFFENPRNTFRAGWAFASMSIASECVETKRGRFFGTGRAVSHPFLVEKGKSDITGITDERTIASLLATIEIPAHGEYTVAVILGEADNRKQAAGLIQKYKDIETARKGLDDTRKWWLTFMKTVGIKTNNPEFDQFQNWLKYQALAERIWARRGFYQSSGAFGFRDQLQDTVNLIWADPNIARRQIILHASHQFIEGDVLHWFFTLTDGRTAFASRSHASDNLLWLVWGVVEYIKYTGDYSILDEMTSYVVSEFPFTPLPRNKHGWGHLYHRSTRADSVYRHCLKSIDLVLRKRMGKHGLPLIGTGDWNDGLDEIGSNGKGESVWLGFFLYYILKDMVNIIGKREGSKRKEHYTAKMQKLEAALEKTWRGDRYLRAIHDDGTEIGVKDSGVWEIDVLTAAWVVMCGFNPERALTMFNTAISVLEKENVILLGWPALSENTKPYLGRSCKYPEGVRENGMYCHGAQWLIRAARILSERFENQGDEIKANEYREAAYRLWLKIAPASHVTPEQIEIYGGQPNKQAADLFTTFDRGRMIWNGYTGAAGWMFRESLEGVAGAALINNKIILPGDLDKPRGELKVSSVHRDISKSPLKTA